ncbi:hypothetical protein HYX14_05705 [Candidatus Woesearchaeota archaeon]|nr:hypothetical protein [Candidatus Woesearchaeota archaeon]
MKKRLIAVLMAFLVVMSTITLAEEVTSVSCTGFWGSISCFLWGSSEARAGKGWFERRALA